MIGLLLTVLAAASGWHGPGVGQATNIAGRWEVTSATSTRRNADGTVDVLATGIFTLDLTVDDTDVTGRWSGATDQVLSLSGSWEDGRLDLASQWLETTVTSSGKPSTVKVRWIIQGAITNGRFGGTRHLEIQGHPREPVLIPWTASRPK